MIQAIDSTKSFNCLGAVVNSGENTLVWEPPTEDGGCPVQVFLNVSGRFDDINYYCC